LVYAYGNLTTNQEDKLYHGKWCGKGYPSEVEFDQRTALNILTAADGTKVFMLYVAKELEPIDAVDKQCAKHDLCYLIMKSTVGDQNGKLYCDFALGCDLRTVRFRGNPSDQVPLAILSAWGEGLSGLYTLNLNGSGHACDQFDPGFAISVWPVPKERTPMSALWRFKRDVLKLKDYQDAN
jgi:hypothetical protein